MMRKLFDLFIILLVIYNIEATNSRYTVNLPANKNKPILRCFVPLKQNNKFTQEIRLDYSKHAMVFIQ
jgi:hypothetical protein